MMFGLWFSLKVHGLQIGAPIIERGLLRDLLGWGEGAGETFFRASNAEEVKRQISHYRVVVVFVYHIQRLGCQPEKTTLHGGQSRSWSAEQGKKDWYL